MMSQDRNLVLVVDDDPGMLKCVQRLLRQHAYEPILFSSAEAFKNYTDVDKADCVILDINLKDGSGIELRHGLKAAGISVPVIYMTGNESSAVREAALPIWMPRRFSQSHFRYATLIEPLQESIERDSIIQGRYLFTSQM